MQVFKPVKGEEHYMAKLTEEQVLWLREQRAQGAKPSFLARTLNISIAQVSNIVARRCWRSV